MPQPMSRAGVLLCLALLLRIETASSQGRGPALSAAELERTVAVDSSDLAVHLALGKALVKERRFDEAEARFRRAAALAPNSAEAYLALGGLAELRGEKYWKLRLERDGREAVAGAFAESFRNLRLAFMLDPLVDPSFLPRAEERVTVTVDGVPIRVWWALPLGKAINRFRAGDYEGAMKRCEGILKERLAGPDGMFVPGAALWVRALAAAHLGLYDTAAADFTLLMTRALRASESSTLDPTPLQANDYRYMAATMHFYAGRFAKAGQMYRETLEADLSLYMAHSQLARILERQGRWDDAIAERRRATEANPEHGNLLADLGFTLKRAGRTEEAVDAFEQATLVNPRDADAFYQAGTAALALGRTDAGRRYLERFVALAPRWAASQVAVARAQLDSLSR